jgi:hypothetical protein
MLKDGTQTATAGIPFYAGTVALPGITFGTDTATGLYRIGLNNTGYSINGTKLLDLSAALLGITGALTVSTTTTLSGALTYGGITLSNAVTGTGNMVLSASPTLTGTLTAAAITASGDATFSQSNAATIYAARFRNTNNGAAASGGIAIGNDASAFGFTFVQNSSAFTAAANYAYIYNQFNAPLILGSNGAEQLRLTTTGVAITGTLGVTGLITSTAGNNAQVFRSASATTGYQYCEFANTGSTLRFGIDSSTGGSLFTGGSAYSANIGTTSATSFQIGTNGVVRMTLDSAGIVTIPGATLLNGQTREGGNAVTATSATTIYAGQQTAGGENSGNVAIVEGVDNGTLLKVFVETVYWITNGSTPTVVGTNEKGAPAGRTYSVSGTNLQVAMAGSASYAIRVKNTMVPQ